MVVTTNLHNLFPSRLFLSLALLALSACGNGLQEGVVLKDGGGAGASQSDDPSGSGVSPPGTMVNGEMVPVDHIPPVIACSSNVQAPRALRRLTPTEVNNSVADIFADGAAPRSTELFGYDPEVYSFQNIAAALQVVANGAAQLQTFAEACAAYASANLAKVASCTEKTDACEQSFIS
ncbi:MAG: DUF1587 domain-containing protein, partial [Deltaproteobacteria bacterium]